MARTSTEQYAPRGGTRGSVESKGSQEPPNPGAGEEERHAAEVGKSARLAERGRARKKASAQERPAAP